MCLAFGAPPCSTFGMEPNEAEATEITSKAAAQCERCANLEAALRAARAALRDVHGSWFSKDRVWSEIEAIDTILTEKPSP